MNERLSIISYILLAIVLIIPFIVLVDFSSKMVELNQEVWELYLDELTASDN